MGQGVKRERARICPPMPAVTWAQPLPQLRAARFSLRRASRPTSGHVKIACLREKPSPGSFRQSREPRSKRRRARFLASYISPGGVLNARGSVTRPQPRERTDRFKDGLLVGLAAARLVARRTLTHGRRRVNLRAGRQRQGVLLPGDREERLVHVGVSGPIAVDQLYIYIYIFASRWHVAIIGGRIIGGQSSRRNTCALDCKLNERGGNEANKM